MLRLIGNLLRAVVFGTGKSALVVRRDKRRMFASRRKYEYLPPRRTLHVLLAAALATGASAGAEEAFIAALGSFSTVYEGLGEERAGNIEKAASALNGIILKAGQTFSFNATLGRRDIDSGYDPAPAFIYGELEPTPGGGVCQVSSTLYNAALLSGFAILERHRHSQPVPYLPAGRDATVSYGSLDLRFRNPHDMPVKLVAEARDGRLSFAFLAPRPLATRYQLRSRSVRESDPDPGARPAEQVVVERLTLEGGKVVKIETVSRDRYPALASRP
ncbi:VanW family protein [bacterium]|nr:VanW family protein [bacterium]